MAVFAPLALLSHTLVPTLSPLPLPLRLWWSLQTPQWPAMAVLYFYTLTTADDQSISMNVRVHLYLDLKTT